MALYQDLLAIRNTLVSFPTSAKAAISDLWIKTISGDDFDLDLDIKEISKIYNLSYQEVLTYYKWYATDRPEKVVVFYNESKWIKNEPCIDSRCDTQLLPRNSVVCAVITQKGAVLHTPYMHENQIDQFKAELQNALIAVWGFNYTADDLIDRKVISF